MVLLGVVSVSIIRSIATPYLWVLPVRSFPSFLHSLANALPSVLKNVKEEKALEEEEDALMDRLMSVRRKRRLLRSQGKALFARGLQSPAGQNPPAPSVGSCRFLAPTFFNTMKWPVGAVVARLALMLLDVRGWKRSPRRKACREGRGFDSHTGCCIFFFFLTYCSECRSHGFQRPVSF